MWQQKSRRATNASRNRKKAEAALFPLVVVLTAVLIAGCGPAPGDDAAPAGDNTLGIRVAPLTDYAWLDRDGNGQPDNPKPAGEREALVRGLGAPPADILVLRGLGSAAALDHLRESLAAARTNYPHAVYVPGPTVYAGIGFLSKREPLETRMLSDQTFRVRDREFQPLAGGIRVATGAGDLWVWNAEAPSPASPYERRRNDARLLAQALRPLPANGTRVLLSLHSREDPDSPMMRGLLDIGLERLTPLDDRGDSWTHRDPDGVNYRMDQWLFLGGHAGGEPPGLMLLDSPDIRAAGQYRHQRVEVSLQEHTPDDT